MVLRCFVALGSERRGVLDDRTPLAPEERTNMMRAIGALLEGLDTVLSDQGQIPQETLRASRAILGVVLTFADSHIEIVPISLLRRYWAMFHSAKSLKVLSDTQTTLNVGRTIVHSSEASTASTIAPSPEDLNRDLERLAHFFQAHGISTMQTTSPSITATMV